MQGMQSSNRTLIHPSAKFMAKQEHETRQRSNFGRQTTAYFTSTAIIQISFWALKEFELQQYQGNLISGMTPAIKLIVITCGININAEALAENVLMNIFVHEVKLNFTVHE